MKIIVDCFGGDKSPSANVEGAVLALKEHSDLSLILTGDENVIKTELDRLGYTGDHIEIVHAPEVITGEDKPTDAIRLKRESSMIKAIAMLRREPDIAGMVSTGATGALIAAATLRIGRIRGIRRPAFCPLLPTMDGGIVGICDSGANVDITPEMLVHQAILGTAYLRNVYNVRNPRVALLNIGVESEKGDDLRKTAYPMLEACGAINFVGNMESRDLLSGKYDLVVCDGFSGNVLVKSTEGTALELLKKLKKDIYSRTVYKLGALLMKKMFMEEKEFMNYHNYGGSVLLGCEKTVVKGHGSSDARAVKICIDQAYRMSAGAMNAEIEAALQQL
ncbi:phosphate acyltransferase PlsX [uncultured Ruminococcus sp.]|uniref:phosphate acyltransferase PlsX n=1 Tax=uncultured Ruminococcus sp. TaxID=165186 RepID=UPI00292FC232|nr:phosphate acyltransferase PlsX [uncultured Ruminococcus sp.]